MRPVTLVQEPDNPPAEFDATTVRPRDGARPVRVSRTLSSYLLRAIVINSLVAFFVLDVIMGIIGTVRVTEKFNVDFLIILPVLIKAMGQAMIYTLPVSLLFGTSLAIGRFRADRELLSMTSFGVSPLHLFVPIVLLGGVLSLCSYEVNQRFVPKLRYEIRNMLTYIVDQIPYLGEGWGLSLSTGSLEIWIDHHDGGELYGIFLSGNGRTGGGPLPDDVLEGVESTTYPYYLFAERARLSPPERGSDNAATADYTIQLEGVSVFVDNDFFSGDDSTDFMQRGYLATFELPIPMAKKRPGIKDRDRGQLAEFLVEQEDAWQTLSAAGDEAGAERARKNYFAGVREGHRRLAIALSCLTFPFAAFAIGLFITSMNRLLPFFVASTIVPGLFFGLELAGGKLAEEGIVPWATEQAGNIALVSMSVVLVTLAVRGPRRSGTRQRRGKSAATDAPSAAS